jgi:hypothetical protein
LASTSLARFDACRHQRLGSLERMFALGVDSLTASRRYRRVMMLKMPSGMLDALKMLLLVCGDRSCRSRATRRQEVVAEGGTLDDPILHAGPKTPLHHVPLSTMIRDRHAERRRIACRCSTADDGCLAAHKGGAQHYRRRAARQRLPVVVAIGPDRCRLRETAPMRGLDDSCSRFRRAAGSSS